MRVAVIGVGHLMHHVIAGLANSRLANVEIRLSARNSARSKDLATRFGLRVEANTDDLVTWADMVIISVRPEHVLDLVAGLPLQSNQTLVSFAATISAKSLQKAAPECEIVLGMPNVAAEYNASATVIYPDHSDLRRLMEACGDVISVSSEAEYEVASLFGAYYGWVQALTGEMSAWAETQGLDADTARRLVASITRSSATRVLEDKETSVAQLVEDLSLPGSLTGDGLAVLQSKKAFDPWRTAAAKILARIRGGD